MEHFPNHPPFTRPHNPDAYLWRYMDLAKYVALLQTRALYLPRADAFKDKLEGSVTRAFQQQAEREGHGTPEDRRKRREKVFLSCWHLNDHESAAMWSLYGRN